MGTEIVEAQPEETQAPTLADVLGKDAAEIETLLAGDEDASPSDAEKEEVVSEEAEEEAGDEEIVADAEPDVEEEEAEEAEDEEQEDEEQEPIALTLASRGDAEDEIIDLEAEDDETREGLALVQRRLEEGELLRTQAEGIKQQAFDTADREAKVQYLEDNMAIDPSGFLLEKVTPEVQQEIMLDLMLDDKLFEFVTEKIEEWADGRSHRKIDAAERKAERTTRTVEAEQQFARGKENREKSQAILTAVQDLVPDDYPLQDANEFYEESLNVLKQHIKQTGGCEPDEVVTVLERKLQRYGITPAANGKKVERAEETGKRFVARRAKKKAAASAPSGAGSAPAAVGPPKGATLKEALDFADANVKFAKTG